MGKACGKVAYLTAALAALLALAAKGQAQAPLVPLPGSPFIFDVGHYSDVILLSRDEAHAFVTNQGSDTVMVLDVGPSGELTGPRLYPVSAARALAGVVWSPNGMATNPAGDRLYVTATDRFGGWGWGYGWGNAAVSVLRIDPDGSLTPLGDTALPWPSFAWGGIVYVPRDTGDFVYVNNNVSGANSVSVLSVDLGSDPASCGTLTRIADVATGGRGTNGDYGWWVSPSLAVARTSAGTFLYAVNGTIGDPGSSDITAFAIGADGGLASLGPPVPVIGGTTSGPIATDPSSTYLYAGTSTGRIARYAISSDGSLTSPVAFPVGLGGPIDAIAVRPDGAFLTAAAVPSVVAAVETASMRPVIGSPVPGVSIAGDTGVSGGVFTADGKRFYAATMGGTVCWSTPIVSGYEFVPQPPIPPLSFTFGATDVAVDHYGIVELSGTLTPSCPGTYVVAAALRQRTGHRIVTATGEAVVTTSGYNEAATWTCLMGSDAAIFKGGPAEVALSTNGIDPVTAEPVSASITFVVNAKPGR